MACAETSSRPGLVVLATLVWASSCWLAGSVAARADGNVSLGVASYPAGDLGTIEFKGIELKDTNLTDGEVAKIFSNGVTGQEAEALFASLKASSISIAEVSLAGKERSFAIRDVRATDVKDGTVGRLSVAASDFTFEVPDVGTANVKVGAVVVENAGVQGMLAGLSSADAADAHLDAGRVTMSDLVVTAPDKDTPKNAPGGNLYRVTLASFEATTRKAAAVETSAAVFKTLAIEPPKASDAARSMAQYGYGKIELDGKFSGRHDAQAKTYVLEDFTISVVGVGSIRLEARLGGIDAAALTGDNMARMQALAEGDISHLSVRVSNSGYFEKALAVAAAEGKKTPQQVKAEWSLMVQAMAFDPSAGPAVQQLSDAVMAFIADPKSLTVSLDGKPGPVKFTTFNEIKSPDELLAIVDIKATAGP
jgi:hypothetical protein